MIHIRYPRDILLRIIFTSQLLFLSNFAILISFNTWLNNNSHGQGHGRGYHTHSKYVRHFSYCFDQKIFPVRIAESWASCSAITSRKEILKHQPELDKASLKWAFGTQLSCCLFTSPCLFTSTSSVLLVTRILRSSIPLPLQCERGDEGILCSQSDSWMFLQSVKIYGERSVTGDGQ